MFGSSLAVRANKPKALFAMSLASLLLASTGVAHAAPVLPSGGTVTSGSVEISAPNASSLLINQTSGKGIITWSQFSIGSGGAVQFNNGSGTTLNRVVGGGPISSIDGLLSATGSLYLINPNGVIIGKSGQVNVGGTFVASTLDLTNKGFRAGGDLTFSGASTATVINLGSIGSVGGDVVLMAQIVRNEGSISAPGGDVGLLAGTTVLLRDVATDDGKFAVQVGGPGTSATNSGSIGSAMAELRANGGNVYALAGNTTGVINATSVSTSDGKVFLVADGGEVMAHGKINATASDGSGGAVQMIGSAVNVTGAHVAAGSWLVQADTLDINPSMASAIAANLASTNITLQTTGALGSGDITIDGHIAWSSPSSLILNAFGNIDVNKDITLRGGALTLSAPSGVATIDAPIKVSGPGSVDLEASDFGFGLTGDGFTGRMSFLGQGAYNQHLTINGQVYTLLYNLAEPGSSGPDSGPHDVAGIDELGDGGLYALSIDLTGQGTAADPQFNSALIYGRFTGTFEGLGHTISNLTISAVDTQFPNTIGLFANTSGTIQDVGLVGGAMAGPDLTGAYIGAIAGVNFSSSTPNSTVGLNALIKNTFASTTITGEGAGGLVGENFSGGATASIVNSFATGAVTGNAYAGGLVGENYAEQFEFYICGCYAKISDVFATGRVNGAIAGGLVGFNMAYGYTSSGVIASVSSAYATGAVTGHEAGGLVGRNFGDGAGAAAITDTFASGFVTADNGGYLMGGLVGENDGSGSGGQAFVTSIATSYWDTTTSGQISGGTNNGGVDSAEGLTTARLTHDGATFTGSAFTGGKDGILPYLVSLPPSRTQ